LPIHPPPSRQLSLGHNVEEVGGRLQSPLSELVDYDFVGSVIGEGTHYISVGGIWGFVPF
jgi:hypothetical protein